MIGGDFSAFSPLVAAASLEQASYPDPRDDFAGSDRKRKPFPTRLHVICITKSGSTVAAVNEGCRSDHWLMAWHPFRTQRTINDKHADQRGEGPDWGRLLLERLNLLAPIAKQFQGVRELRQKL